MSQSEYAQIPKSMALRELRVVLSRPGYRTTGRIVPTTLTDPADFTAADIAKLYGHRWNVELDIRHIKASLNLGHVRCKSPAMVAAESWTTLLAYSLSRSTATCADLFNKTPVFEVPPRQISFTSVCQYVLSRWAASACSRTLGEAEALLLLSNLAGCRVGDRPGRVEPRVLKKRPSPYPLMRQARATPREQPLAA